MSVESIETATKELIDLVQEARIIKSRLAEMEAETSQLRDRLNDLDGFWSGRGLITIAKSKLEQAKRLDDDSRRREVVWVGNERADYVVDKITPKRIYVRKRGCEVRVFYNIDGSASASFGRTIDIDKTFPEGLDNYVNNQRSSS